MEMSPPALMAFKTAMVPDLPMSSRFVRILDRGGPTGPVRNGLDEIGLSLDLLWIVHVPDLVEGIRRIRNQLTEKDFLVGIEGVDDQAHQLLNVDIAREGLRHGFGENLEQC